MSTHPPISWKKSADGYSLTTPSGEARMYKSGKTWFVESAGRSVALGSRASFDNAEGVILEEWPELLPHRASTKSIWDPKDQTDA